MRKLLTAVLSCFIALLLCTNVQAQKRAITGKVVDSIGNPIPNVTVRLRSARGGVTTGEDGTFHISALPTDDLLISNIGFQPQEVRIGNRENLTITLGRLNTTLNEVVVTALGIRRSHNSLPYSTQQITGGEITKTPSSNFVDNLSGKVAGLQVTSSNTMGGSNNVILRGVRSLTQSNQALFVVDGVPYDNTNQSRNQYDLGNSVSDINPDDIESMSVLKGAAASALYGSRGSNGVILITTKKGSKRKGIGVTVNAGVTTGTPDQSTLPSYQLQYGQGYGSQGVADAGNANPYFYWQKTAFSNGQPVQIVQTDVDQATGPAYDKNLMVYNWDAFSPGNPNYGKATPWMPAAHNKPTDYFNTPLSNVLSVSADGGDDKGTFRLGYTRTNDKGYLPNSNQRKTLLNMSATYNLNEKLSVGGQINYSDEAAVGRYAYGYGGGNGTQINPMTDFRQWWQTNADLNALKSDFFRTLTNVTWNWQTASYLQNTTGSLVKPNFHDNPWWVRYKNFETDSRSRYTGNVFANYKPTSYLNVLARVSLDSWNQMQEFRYDVGSYGTPSYGRYNGSFTETNYDLLINFNKDLTPDFNLKALLGGNIRQDVNQSISASTNGGLVVPGFFALTNSVNTPNAPSESYSLKEVDGIFAGATLSYKDMITLDGTLRRDKSSTLPNANSSFYYPSVSANWVFSKLIPEAQQVLNYGKVWVNYAAVGGDAPVYYTKNTYTAGTPFNGQTVFSTPSSNFNPTLVPEQNHTYEAGAELSFLHSRIGLTLVYYNSKQSNEILPITVSSSSGYSTFYVNGGTVQNIGQEITLNLVPVKTRDFTWNMTINWSHNKNKAISLYAGQPSYVVSTYQNAVQVAAEVGKSVGIIRGTDYQYLNGKRLIDDNGLPVKSTNKLSDIGNINPDWLGGINNSLSYKSFALSFLIDIRHGGDVYSLDQDYGASGGLTPHSAGFNSNHVGVRAPLAQGGGYLFTGLTADGKPNTKLADGSDINTGKYLYSSLFAEAAKTFIYDASFVKLREVAITYTLPAKTIAKMGVVKGMEFSLSGKNLWIIHKNLPDSDPEQGVAVGSGNSAQNGSQGFQSGAYPVFRTFGANVRVRF
ncbi:SusC/RagA family TonB-linked outer membrane protein [Puia sp.]|uniref:SusC/RagA family TonB-linked outer membrane protein n=1 Tax=Puia sp. TaxID=2045100 RepID=UPI002F3F9F49